MLTDTNNWIVRDPQISSRGAKSCQIEYALQPLHVLPGGDSKIRFNLGSKELPTKTPFGATTFNNEESAQKTIEFNITEDEDTMFHNVIDWIITHLTENSERIFKKLMSREQIADSFRSPITRRTGYGPHIRCKIRPSNIRVWDAYGKIREGGLPNDLRNYMLVPRMSIEKLWIMSRECGLVLQVCDLMILEREEHACPF